MIKKLVAVIVLVLVVCTFAGCTTSTTSNTNQTPSATSSAAAQHDAFLEKYLAAYKNGANSSTLHIQVWELTWINSTSAQLEWTAHNKTTNSTWNYVETIMVFPTSQGATQYLNAMNKTAYSLASTEYKSGGAYQKATGHAPQIYKKYQWNEGNPFNISEYKYHEITQLDNIVFVSTGKNLG